VWTIGKRERVDKEEWLTQTWKEGERDKKRVGK